MYPAVINGQSGREAKAVPSLIRTSHHHHNPHPYPYHHHHGPCTVLYGIESELFCVIQESIEYIFYSVIFLVGIVSKIEAKNLSRRCYLYVAWRRSHRF